MKDKPTYKELEQRINELETEATQLKRAKNALWEDKENYKRLTEQLSDVVLTVNLGGTLSYLSPAIKEFGGYDPEEEIGSHIGKYFVNKTDLIKALKLIKQIYIKKKPASIEFLFKALDKEPFFVEVTGRPLILENKVKSIHCVMRNIVDRKQAEEQIKIEREKLLSIFDSIDEVIYVADPDTYELLYVNGAFKKNWGDGLGQKCYSILQNRHSPCPFCTNHHIFGENLGQPYIWEFQNTVNGRWYRCIDKAISWPDGRVVRYELAVDIHDRKQAEDERLKLEIQLQQSQKMESIGNLAGGIAHDFNNILSSIIGFTELALDDAKKDSMIEDYLQEVYTSGKRAKELVSQILAFARQSEEKVKPIQVDEILEEVIQFIRSSTPSSIEIKKNIESDSLIMGNKTQVHQIMMNLCTNATHAMEDEGGVLEISVKDIEVDRNFDNKLELKHGDYITISATDTGVGIPPHIIDSIFDPYFTTKGPGKGTGMGLAMVHGIVESYGGKISVDSKLGKGTTLTVYLPVTRKRQIQRQYEPEQLPTGTERILFVDDEAPIAKMGGQGLERLGYIVTTRTSSIEALELFRSKPNDFDLVITDMTMPNMTGDILATELMTIRPDIPVILCTGYSKKISDETASEIGIKAFAYKPVVKAELAKTVRKVLDDANGFKYK